uniref:Uncharacterized protein n=1 Tax=Steinernema glaseri TaxID=37863 RepID=A0A1I8AIQ0_9BILA
MTSHIALSTNYTARSAIIPHPRTVAQAAALSDRPPCLIPPLHLSFFSDRLTSSDRNRDDRRPRPIQKISPRVLKTSPMDSTMPKP